MSHQFVQSFFPALSSYLMEAYPTLTKRYIFLLLSDNVDGHDDDASFSSTTTTRSLQYCARALSESYIPIVPLMMSGSPAAAAAAAAFDEHYLPLEPQSQSSLSQSQSHLWRWLLVVRHPVLFLNAVIGAYIGLKYGYRNYRRYIERMASSSSSSSAATSTSSSAASAATETGGGGEKTQSNVTTTPSSPPSGSTDKDGTDIGGGDDDDGTDPVHVVGVGIERSPEEEEDDMKHEASWYTGEMYRLWTLSFVSFAMMNVVAIPYHCLDTVPSFPDAHLHLYHQYPPPDRENPWQTKPTAAAAAAAFVPTSGTLSSSSLLWGLDCFFTGLSSFAIVLAAICMMRLLLVPTLAKNRLLSQLYQQSRQLEILEETEKAVQHQQRKQENQPQKEPSEEDKKEERLDDHDDDDESTTTTTTTTAAAAATKSLTRTNPGSYVTVWYTVAATVVVLGFTSLLGTHQTMVLECWYLLPTYLSIYCLVPTMIAFHREESRLGRRRLPATATTITTTKTSKAASSLMSDYRWYVVLGPLLFLSAVQIDAVSCSYQSYYVGGWWENEINDAMTRFVKIILHDSFMIGTLGFFASNVSFHGIALWLEHYYDCGLYHHLLLQLRSSGSLGDGNHPTNASTTGNGTTSSSSSSSSSSRNDRKAPTSSSSSSSVRVIHPANAQDASEASSGSSNSSLIEITSTASDNVGSSSSDHDDDTTTTTTNNNNNDGNKIMSHQKDKSL